MEKKFKADYMAFQVMFLDKLKNISTVLKMQPLENRPTYLYKRLVEAN